MRSFVILLILIYLSFLIVLFLLSYREHEQYTIVYSATVGSHENFDIFEIGLDGQSRRSFTNGNHNFAARYANDVICSANNEAIYITAGGLYRINRDGTGFA